MITVKSSPTRTGMWYNGGVTSGDEYNRNTNQEGKSMKKKTIRLTGFALAMMLSLSPIVPAGSNPFVFTAEAHSGRTDSSGGHRDNKNKSGLGSYHYHCGGYPAHLHTNGVCPYKNGAAGSSGSTGSANGNASGAGGTQAAAPIPETTAAAPVETLGWKQDEKGWWYKDSETTYKKDGVYNIDGNYYAFNAEGYMITGWQEIGEYWYYFDGNGHMLIDVCTVIDGSYCYFDQNGRWDEEYYDSFSDYLDNYDY